MIPRSANAFTVLMLVQFILIVSGTLVVIGVMKLKLFELGESESDDSWVRFYVAYQIRSFGWIAVFMPAIWYILGMVQLRKRGQYEFGRPMIVSAFAVNLILFVFYISICWKVASWR